MGARLLRTSSAVVLAAALLLAACSTAEPTQPEAAAPAEAAATDESTTSHGDDHGAEAGDPGPQRPLRDGERRLTLAMPEPYEPSPPTNAAKDDYRCFLLDPGLEDDAVVTGTDVQPGNPRVVHHVILFQVPPDQVEDAEQLDEVTDGQGWTCFGGSGVDTGGRDLDDAPWLGAWAPGGGESVLRAGYGAPLEQGSRIVMQVHYNLLAVDEGDDEGDVSAAVLRVADADAGLTPVSTMLLPAPVELPCRPAYADGPLCERDAAVADLEQRVGMAAAADWLHILCGSPVQASQVTSCDRRVTQPSTVLGVAGHMHLLGTQIRVEVNPGTPRARTLLDIEEWNFDDQSVRPTRPFRLRPGDELRVTCRHSQAIRDQIPAFDGQPDRYVVWGEGTTDEMCLGILQVAPA